MSIDALLSMARDGWSLVAGDPWALGAFGVLLISGAGAIVMLALSTRRPSARVSVASVAARRESRGRARGRTPRAARVVDLARHGEAPESIARRTGLALDAVATILRTTGELVVPEATRPVRDAMPAAATRHASPTMASFAARPTAR